MQKLFPHFGELFPLGRVPGGNGALYAAGSAPLFNGESVRGDTGGGGPSTFGEHHPSGEYNKGRPSGRDGAIPAFSLGYPGRGTGAKLLRVLLREK